MTRSRTLGAALFLVAAVACGSGRGPSSTTTTSEAPASTTTAADGFGPTFPANPRTGPSGSATMHGDSGSSDTTPLEGPGVGPISVAVVPLGAVCSTIVVGSDGYPVALCTRVVDTRPVVHLLDPANGGSLASIELTPGELLSGVYGYLDDRDRLVVVDGAGDLQWIAHRRTTDGWALEVDRRIPLAASIPAGDAVTSVSADVRDGVWFATGAGVAGWVGDDGAVETLPLGAGERVANSISTAPEGAAVATDHALYLVERGAGDRLAVAWRTPYDRGPARKPGQLSWGTGSTPTFFGPSSGADYVAIVDNADPRVRLVVVRATGPRAGSVLCATEVLGRGGPGSENSPIGVGRTVVVASTYGDEYPRLPADAGPSVPEQAPFTGGMTRVDVRADETGCDVVWDTSTRSTAVPKLSTADHVITTMMAVPSDTGPDTYEYAVIDPGTGDVLAQRPLVPGVGDPLQLAGTTGPGRVLWQGTLGVLLRISPG